MKFYHKCPICERVWGHKRCTSEEMVTPRTWGATRENQACLPCMKEHYPDSVRLFDQEGWRYQEDPFVTWTRKVRKNDNKKRAAKRSSSKL